MKRAPIERGWLLWVGLVAVLVIDLTPLRADDNRSPSVGAPGYLEQVVLPGTELKGKPLNEGDPIVVRIVNVFPHADRFRYDIRFHGMEPGHYDLSKWLERKDGSSTSDLPELSVEVRSLLPPGQIEPNGLETGWMPRLGGYRNVMIAVVVLWTLGLLALIFVGRRKAALSDAPEKPRTLADLLRERIELALKHQMDSSRYAELERMLTAFWRRKLDLESVPPHLALAKIKADEQAGPLMKQIESWMHSPNPNNDVDLVGLLEPFRDLPADTPEFEHGERG